VKTPDVITGGIEKTGTPDLRGKMMTDRAAETENEIA
jgi:hypothetical protein